jgi:cyclic pyranopterin phosphate synthase
MSITDRCNLRCAYCQPASGLTWISDENQLNKDDFVRLAEAAASLGITKIRITGGEPLIHPDVLEIIQRIGAIPGIEDLSLTSNAILLEKLAGPMVDTLDPEKYRRVTRFGDFNQAWRGILAAEKAGLSPIKLNSVVVGDFNDDEIPALARLSIDHPWHIRFIELMPVANSQDWGDGLPPVDKRYVSVQTMHDMLADLSLKPETTSSNSGPERMFRIPGAPGTVGFISPLGEHFCARCNRLRLTADGRLRSCLLVDKEISIRDAIKSGADLEEFIKKAVEEKPRGHELHDHNCPDTRCMSQIGG